MNAAQVLDHFDRISDAPEAVPRLRRFILDLAVRGKLVQQDPNDEPASELFKQIQAEKERHTKNGKLKQQLLPSLKDEDVPFSVPHSWTWVRLGVLAEKITDGEHLSPNKTTSGMPLLTATHVTSQGVTLNNPQFVSFADACKFRQRCDPSRGDILICSRGTIGRCAVVNTDETFCLMGSVILVRIPKDCSSVYFNYFLSTDRAQLQMSGMSGATAVHALYLKDIRLCPVAVPPLAEQHRIVAKVDELMELCDRLEAAQAERESRRNKLAAASLRRLNNGADADEFREHARFHLRHIPRLTTRPEHIQQLRQTILNLAVRGKLVPQDPDDELASELLKRIQTEKERLIQRGTIKKQEPLSASNGEDLVSKLPASWTLARVIDIAFLRSGIAINHGDDSQDGKIPYVKVADLNLEKNQKGIVTSTRFIGTKYEESIIFPGSIVFPKRGGAIATNRKRVSRVDIICDSNLMALKPFLDETLAYIQLWFSGFDLWKLNSGTSVPQINNKDIYPLRVALPPIAEQHRIVAKVDELMALCDRLEAQLTTIQTEGRRFLEVILHKGLIENISDRQVSE